MNDKKNKKATSTYNKMFALFMGNARMSTFEDAYNTLVNIKKSKEIEVIKKGEFHELKSHAKLQKKKRNVRKTNS